MNEIVNGFRASATSYRSTNGESMLRRRSNDYDSGIEKRRLAYHVEVLDTDVLADQAFYMLFNEWYEAQMSDDRSSRVATDYADDNADDDADCDRGSDNDVDDKKRENELLEHLRRLKITADRISAENVAHTLQIRSTPVSDFGFVLRHYFVRLDELIEVHPGNEEKICLRGWMRNVDIGSDCLVATYRLCKSCTDRALSCLWSCSRKFSFAFRNCDQNCNGARQSLGIASTIFLILVALISLFVQQTVVPFCLIVTGLTIGYSLLSFSQSLVSPRMLRLLGANPAVVERNVGLYMCDHVSRSTKSPTKGQAKSPTDKSTESLTESLTGKK